MPSAHIPLYASVESLQWEVAVAYFTKTKSRLTRGWNVCYAGAVGLAFVNTPIASYTDLFGFTRLCDAWVKHIDWVLCEETTYDTCSNKDQHSSNKDQHMQSKEKGVYQVVLLLLRCLYPV